jgi:hypothetical protein
LRIVRFWKVAGPSLEGGQVAVLRLNVMALSNSYCIMASYLDPARDSEHEGNTRGRIVRRGRSVEEDRAIMSYFDEFFSAGRAREHLPSGW